MPKSKAGKSKKGKAKPKKAKSKKSKKANKKKEDTKKNKDTIKKEVKNVGIICACFTIFQAIVIFILAFIGIVCSFFECGNNKTAASFRYIYQSKSFLSECPMTIVKPIVFFFICIFYALLCITWIVVSVLLISALRAWKDVPTVRKAGNIWSIVTLIVIIVDIAVYFFFLIDFVFIAKDPHCKEHNRMSFSGLEVELPDDEPEPDDNLDDLFPPDNPVNNTNVSTTTPKITEENVILNPFVRKKTWDQVLWPSKVKTKMNTSDTSVIPLRQQRQSYSLRKILNLMSINEMKIPPNVAPYLPALIAMLVAIKLIFAWVANVFLLAYFRIKLAGVKNEDDENIAQKTKNFFQKLNPFADNGKGKCKGKRKGKGKCKGKKKSKKGTKKAKKSKKKKTCFCGIRSSKPKKAKRKKCK